MGMPPRFKSSRIPAGVQARGAGRLATSAPTLHGWKPSTSLAGEIAVMDHGSIVEHAGRADLLARPQHPLTRELLDAARALSLEGAPA